MARTRAFETDLGDLIAAIDRVPAASLAHLVESIDRLPACPHRTCTGSRHVLQHLAYLAGTAAIDREAALAQQVEAVFGAESSE